jgi:hypothetical protein
MPKAGDLGDVHPQFFRASNAIQVESGSANLKKFPADRHRYADKPAGARRADGQKPPIARKIITMAVRRA